ncbi:MAG: hypothetical protein ABI281_09635 [Caldimonas sp.]
MFAKSSLVLGPVSGFVAFDGGGAAMPPAVSYPTSAKAPVVARARVAEPEVAPVMAPAVETAPGLRQSSTWQPASTLSVRRVEGAVLLSICGYFAFGAARLFNLI